MVVDIKSPVNGYNGKSANVIFARGLASEVEITKTQAEWFKKKGYVITELKSKTVNKDKATKPKTTKSKKEKVVEETVNTEENKEINTEELGELESDIPEETVNTQEIE